MLITTQKVEKAVGLPLMRFVSLFKPSFGTTLAIWLYGRWGMIFSGRPNYLSARAWFDGTDYSLIRIGEGTTISSGVSLLTHDWSLTTVARSAGVLVDEPIGNVDGVTVGDYVFIGRGSTIMPGSTIGDGSLIGAGSVVRGDIPPRSLVVGNPAVVMGDTAEYLARKTGLSVS